MGVFHIETSKVEIGIYPFIQGEMSTHDHNESVYQKKNSTKEKKVHTVVDLAPECQLI